MKPRDINEDEQSSVEAEPDVENSKLLKNNQLDKNNIRRTRLVNGFQRRISSSECTENNLTNGEVDHKMEEIETDSSAQRLMLTPKGLPNLGNTCFFNSVMQCIMNTHPIGMYLNHVRSLKQIECLHNYKTKICDKTIEISPMTIPIPEKHSMPLTTFFASFISEYYRGGHPSPHLLFTQICLKAPRFRGYAQQDSHELLRYFLDGLRQEETDRFRHALAKYIMNSGQELSREEVGLKFKALIEGPAQPILHSVFGGILQQSIKCLRCGYISIRYEPFLDLSLPVSTMSYNDAYNHNNNNLSNYSKQDKRRNEDFQREKNNKSEEELGKGGGRKLSKHQMKKEAKRKMKNFLKENRKLRNQKVKEELKLKNNKASECSGPLDFVSASANGEEQEGKDIMNRGADNSDEAEDPVEEQEEEAVDEEDDLKESDDGEDLAQRSDSNVAVNDDIIELTELDLADFNPGVLSVVGALKSFTTPEILTAQNAYECEKCCPSKKKKANDSNAKSVPRSFVDASKRYLISKPPLVLTLHLKRFEQVYGKGRVITKKFRGYVEFQKTLNLAPFCRKSVKRIVPKQRELLYNLYGIVSHSGELGGGHYIAYVKARPQMRSLMRRLFDESLVFEPDSLSDVIIQKCQKLTMRENGQLKEDEDPAAKIEQQRTGNVNVDKAVTNNNHSGEGAHQHNGVIINNDEPLIKSRSEALSYIEQMDRQSKWYCISDSYVQTVPESRVLNAEAYILFYERVY